MPFLAPPGNPKTYQYLKECDLGKENYSQLNAWASLPPSLSVSISETHFFPGGKRTQKLKPQQNLLAEKSRV